MPPVLAFGAIALAGVALVALFEQHAKEQAEQEAFRAANGWSLEEVASALTGDFDRDRDGRLAYDVIQGVRTLGESARTVSETFTEPAGFLSGLPSGTKVVKERRTTWTIEPMLRRADADHDGVVTHAELLGLLRSYDPDGNGRVTKADFARARAELGAVQASSETRTVGVVPPTPAPGTGSPTSPRPH